MLNKHSFYSQFSKQWSLNKHVIYLFLSVMTGGIYFSLFFSLQDILEASQVSSGGVLYPRNTIQAELFQPPFNLLNLLSVSFFKLGFNEILQSKIFSSLIGALSFGAITCSLSKDSYRWLPAFIIPMIISVTGIYNLGVIYDIDLGFTNNTIYMVGFWLNILAMSFYFNRVIYFVLITVGLFIHPTITFLFLFISIAAEILQKKLSNRVMLIFALFVLVFSLTNLFDLTFLQNLFPNLHDQKIFMANWDMHRRPVPWWHLGSIINLLIFLISLNVFLDYKKESKPFDYYIGFILVASAIGIISSILSHISYSYLSYPYLLLIAPRAINISIIASLSYMVFNNKNFKGKDSGLQLIFILYLGVLCFFIFLKNLNILSALVPFQLFATCGFLVYLCLILLKQKFHFVININKTQSFAVFTSLMGLAAMVSSPFYPNQENLLIPLNSSEKGLLITCPTCMLMQIKTSSPVFLNLDTIDVIPYYPKKGLALTPLVKKYYNIDLTQKRPKEWQWNYIIQPDYVKSIWESRSKEEWEEILTPEMRVVTPINWKLNLPFFVKNRYLFYHR